MRAFALLAVVFLCGCAAERRSREADTMDVHDAFDEHVERGDSVIMEATPTPVLAAWLPESQLRAVPPEVRAALEDLVARGSTDTTFPAVHGGAMYDHSVSADSVRALLRQMREHGMRRLPGRASIVRVSGVGFNRERTVAVVWHQTICGTLCGGSEFLVVRKYPRVWVPAEVLFATIH